MEGTYEGADTASQFVPANALFGAALVGASSGASSSLSSIDAWGNTKIPWIEFLDPSTEDADGWYSVPQLNSSDDFTSLIGISLSLISDATNLTTSFNIEASYWTLSCPVYGNLTDPDATEEKLAAEMNNPRTRVRNRSTTQACPHKTFICTL